MQYEGHNEYPGGSSSYVSKTTLFMYGEDVEIMQFTGLPDKNGKDIYFKDILQFDKKWEWYKNDIISKTINGASHQEIQTWLDTMPYKRRVVEDITDYEWLLSSEIQQYWKVVGNIYENPEII